MDGFESAQEKLRRAVSAAEAVLASAAEWQESTRLMCTAAVEPSSSVDGVHDVVVRLHGLPQVQASLVLDLDEAVHHARSALDHVVWQLLIDNHGVQTRQAYPILKRPPKQAADWDRYVGGLPAGAVAQIREHQPYATEGGPGNNRLWWLHELDLQAKHRAVVPVPVLLDEIRATPPAALNGKDVSLSWYFDSLEPAPWIVRIHNVPQEYEPPDPAEWVHWGDKPPRLALPKLDEDAIYRRIESLMEIVDAARIVVEQMVAHR